MKAEREAGGLGARLAVGVGLAATALMFSASWADAPSNPSTPTTDLASGAAATTVGAALPAPVAAQASTTSSPTTPEVLPPPPSATLLTVPSTLTGDQLAARSVASYYVALDAGDLVGAFDHLSAERGAEFGGFEVFASIWRAVDAIAAEPATCREETGVMVCEATVRLTGADGSCVMATNVMSLSPSGDRFRIVGEQALGQEPCSA